MMGSSDMRNGVSMSISAHLLLVLFAQYGLPNLFTPRDVSVVTIPVEIVTDEQLNAPLPPATPEPKPEPKPEAAPPPPPPEPEPEPEVVEALPPPPEPKSKPEVVEALPPPPVEKPKPPKKKEPLKPKPPAKAEPQSKPKPPKKPKSFASVLKDLDKLEKKSTPKVKKEATPKDKNKPAPDRQITEQASVTEIERLKQIIRRQIEPCWSPPVGAAEAESLAITIFIRVDRKGFVREARVIDAPAMALNTYVQAAADAARRAVLNPRCQPFQLPIKRYDLWKEIRFNFDPREMLS